MIKLLIYINYLLNNQRNLSHYGHHINQKNGFIIINLVYY